MSALIPRKAAQRNKFRDRRQRDLRPGRRGPTGGTTRGLPLLPHDSFAYANQQAAGPRPPGGWSSGQGRGPGTIVPDSRGALDGESARGGRTGVLGVVCWVLTDIDIPHGRGRLRRAGVWGNRPPRHAGRRGRAALCLQGFSARASGCSSWDLGSPVPPVRPALSIPPRPGARCVSLASPRRSVHTWSLPYGEDVAPSALISQLGLVLSPG